MFSLICAWTNGWVNNRSAGDLRRHRAYYGVTVFYFISRSVENRSVIARLSVLHRWLWQHCRGACCLPSYPSLSPGSAREGTPGSGWRPWRKGQCPKMSKPEVKISTDCHCNAKCFDIRGQWQIIISMVFHYKNRNRITLSVIDIYITITGNVTRISLQWRHNEHDGVSKHRRLDCFSTVCSGAEQRAHRKLRVTRLCDRWIPLTKGHFLTSSLFQVMACHLIDIKPILASIKNNFDLKCSHFLWMHLKISSAN